ncbi:amidophosphoribosyltransferase [Alphaproteobacteria bacterium]|jgi:amidophosphoribosyltransferase|nr:amidophosphoribosyltransferase [Alphaproteobacteria bacterium]MDA8642468.1 amidophosphoribosyltransferase [Alphaproteobacteria bacterium]MDA8666784.1 amidophosphoribosyltransferase [Alphaproteobacteria bacterium]MDA9590479.1 amidophosphoribosyltransferase [Alphaproteobacteria bacterium]MDB2432313.1 amidophosphoribosyltransferase [Alphaproteobacteria bacterium]
MSDNPQDTLYGDRLREECGVFGIFGHADAAALTTLGLHALQHRGQEAAGIVSFDGKNFFAERRLGLVSDHFTKANVLDQLQGTAAVGHVRYSTTGETILRNVQPLFADLTGGGFAIAHNGNLTNALTLRDELVKQGAIFQSTSDTETILQLVARSKRINTLSRFTDALFQIEGAYALVVMTNKKLIGARDPLGIRPLVIGKLDGAYILASETCALDIIGAKFVREVENGEIVVITDDGIESIKPFPPMEARPCIFEYIYFARPDSTVGGKSVYECRKEFGRQLAEESHVDADVVIPVPDSGVPAAIGYGNASGVPFELGIIRNHYVGRTFIEPQQSIRAFSVKLKHNANRVHVEGKRVILIDDSIVRGTTSVKIVQMMRDAGATEVHMRIGAPPITHPDFYGIDTPDQDSLLAAQNTLEEMRAHIGADSLAFLSVDGLYKAMGYPEGRNAERPQFTDHCFTGDYPTGLADQQGDEKLHQLSLLAEQG